MKFSDYTPRRPQRTLTRQLLSAAPARRVFVIANPASPKLYQAIRLITQAASRLGIPTPTVLTTTPDSPGTAQARQALDQGAELVLVAGGDGTVRLVAGVLAGTDT
ncbi:MAG: acylglycerol kinase family protein, partial [Propionibacteriaceae bacterium]|nr:acylglycerol kinase family protein [Propionibacteriaceae bacterium]